MANGYFSPSSPERGTMTFAFACFHTRYAAQSSRYFSRARMTAEDIIPDRWSLSRPIALTHFRTVAVLVLWALSIARFVSAQDTLEVTMPTLEIQATRSFESTLSAARSVYVKHRDDAIVRPGLSLQRALRGIPGVRITDRGHYGLGERVIVRGMGYRAAFGVRGVQTFLNGIPLTMPDGQSMLDVVDPAFINRAELLRGLSSMYWGNASGGVLFLSTRPDSSQLSVRYMGGSHGLAHAMGSASVQGQNWELATYSSWVNQNGYRDHSDGGFFRLGVTGQARTGSMVFSGLFNMALQDVNSPGSLTAAQFSDNPRQADPRYITQDAGKESRHILGGVSMNAETPAGTVTATTYFMQRYVDNPLTYAWITLDRLAGGAYVQLNNSAGRFSWSTGGDFRRQRDWRRMYGNDKGTKDESGKRLDQYENVTGLAAFATAQARISQRFGLTAGARIDGITFDLSDDMLDNGDQTGSRKFTSFSHSLGTYFVAQEVTMYFNWSTSFESPTTTEFINTPVIEGRFDGGFNPELGPQRASGIEAGLRGHIPSMNLLLDIAGYTLRIRDRLVPQQTEDGRTWYENVGRNRHAGVEGAITWPTGHAVQANVAYNYSQFQFRSDPGFGLRVPGIPEHQLQASVLARIGEHWTVEITTEYASETFADQKNLTPIDSYAVIDLHLARNNWYIGPCRVSAFARIQNLLNNSYSGSLIVNAFGGRYFEPSPERAFQLGIGLAL